MGNEVTIKFTATENISATMQKVILQTEAMIDAMRKLNGQVASASAGSTKSINDLTTATNKLEEATRKQVKTVESSGASWTTLASQYYLAKNAINAVVNSLQTWGSVYVDVAKAGADFERTLDNIMAVQQETKENMQAIAAAALEAGRTTVYSANESAQAMLILAQAGFSAREQIEALPAVLNFAAAAGTTLERSAFVLSTTMRQFNMATTDATHIADVFSLALAESQLTATSLVEAMKYAGPAGAAFGQSLEETVALVSKFVDMGFEGSMAGTNFRMALSFLAKGTRDSADALKGLGMTMQSVNPMTHQISEIVATFGDALEKAGRSSMTAMEGIAIFGQRAGPAMAQVINTQMTLASESEKNLGNLVRRMQEVDEVARDMAKTMTDNVWGSVKKLQNVVNDLKLAFFSAFGDQLKKALDMVRDSILGNKHTIVEIAAESLEDFVAVARTLLVVTSPLIITLGSLYVGFKILIGAVLAVAESLASLAAGDLQGAKKAWTDYATGVARSAEANAMLAETIQSVIYETQGFTVNTELASKTIGMLSQTAQAEMPKFQKEFMVALEAASDSMVELRNTSKDIAKEIFGILASPDEQAKQDMEDQIADWEQQIVDARQRISDLWAKSEGEGGALIPGALENIEQMEAEVKAMEARIAEYRAAKTKEINDKAAEERSKETEAVKREIEKQHKERIKKLKEWVDNMGKQAKDASARQIALDQKAFETRMMQYNREQDLVRRNMEERKYLMEQLVETGEMFISSLSQFGSASSAGGALSGAGGLIGSLLKGIGTGVRAAGGKGDVGDLGKLISSIGEYTSAVFGYVGMAAEFLTKLPDVVNKVIPEIIKNLPSIVKNGLAVLPKLLRDELPAIVRTVVEDVIPAMLKALPEIVAALIEGLVTAVGVLIENLPEIIGQAFEAGVKVLVNGILGAVSDLFGKLGENLGLGKGVGKAIGYMVNPTNAIGDIADGLGFGGGNAAKNRERRAEEAQQAYSAGVAGSTDAVLAVLSALGRFADKDLTNAVTNLKQIEGGIDGVLKKMWETDDLNDEMVAQLNLHTEELKAQIDVLKDYRDSLRQLKEAFREVRNNIRDIRDEIATQGVFGADPEKVLELERKRLGKTFASFAKEVANNAVTPESAAAVAESVKSWFMNAAQRIQDGLKAQLDILDKEVQNAYSRWEKIRKEAESKAEEDYKNAVESLKDQINDTFADTKAKAEAWRDGMLRSIDGVFTNLSDKLGGLKDLADNLARVQERRTDIGFKMTKTQKKLMGASDEEMTQFVNNQDLKNFMNTLFSAAGQAGMSQQGLAKYTTGTVGQVGGFDPFWEKFVAGQANQGPLSAETINELAESVNQLAEAGAIDYKQFDMLSQYILALSDKTEQTSKDMIEQQKTAFLDAFHNSGMSTGTFDIAEATRMSAEELRKLVEERVTAGDFAGAEDALARLRDEEKWLVQQAFEQQVADAQALRDADLLLAVNGTHPLLADAIAKRDADIAQAKLDYDAAVARTDAWAAAFTSGLVAQANKELSATRAAANFVLGLVEGIVQTEMDRLTSAIEELTREIQIARGYVSTTQVDKQTEDEIRRGFLQLPIGTGPIPDDQVVQLHRGERVMTQEQYRRTVSNAAMSGGSDPQVSAALQRIASLLESGQGGEAGPVIIELHMDTDLEKIVAKGIRKNAERNNLVVSGSTINVKQV